MPVSTTAVRNRLIGDARKSFEDVAGSNHIVSKTEAKKLPADLAKAVNEARAKKSTVRVNDAVDAYATKVSKVLKAVDKGTKGKLTVAEAKKIIDPALRTRVLDIRAALAKGGTGVVTDPTDPPATPGLPKTAAVLAAMQAPLNAVATWWESGDNGVNVSAAKVTGAKSFAEALTKAVHDENAPWTWSEHHAALTPAAGAAQTVAAFADIAKEDLLLFQEDGGAEAEAFADGVQRAFAGLTDVRLANGSDLGATYLLGKTKDGYVSVVCQPYRDA